MKRDFRKPLVIAGPKTCKFSITVVLRLNGCVSKFEDMGPNSKFERILQYSKSNLSDCKSIIFCSGKFVYDIQKMMDEAKVEKTGLVTV
jgi:2-oxoglutarate dehydrogenase E1 component